MLVNRRLQGRFCSRIGHLHVGSNIRVQAAEPVFIFQPRDVVGLCGNERVRIGLGRRCVFNRHVAFKIRNHFVRRASLRHVVIDPQHGFFAGSARAALFDTAIALQEPDIICAFNPMLSVLRVDDDWRTRIGLRQFDLCLKLCCAARNISTAATLRTMAAQSESTLAQRTPRSRWAAHFER